MNFTHAAWLSALAPLVAIPLVIHLLNRRFPQWKRFSSIELVKKSLAQRSQLIRWRHWLLTLLRTLFMAACVIAFLGPMLPQHGQPPVAQSKRRALIVIDHSYSMETPEDNVSRRARAKVEAGRVLDSLGAEDEVNVIAVGSEVTSAFTGWSLNHSAAKAFISAIGPGLTDADHPAAVSAILGHLQDKNANAEVYWISDFQRTSWSDANFQGLPKEARLFFINVVKGTGAENHAITDVEITSPAILAGGEVEATVTVANHSASQLSAQVEAVLDERTSVELPASVRPWSVQQFPLHLQAPGPGWHKLQVRLKQPDHMPLDDVFHCPLLVSEQEEVLLITDDAPTVALTARFLDAAINPYGDKRGSLLPRHISSTALQPPDLSSTSKVVMTRVAKIDEPRIRKLADFMKSGGGVLYFMDGPQDAQNLQLLAAQFSQADAVPLILGAKMGAQDTGTEGMQIAKGKFDSRYLRLFRGTARSALAQLSFYERWHARPVEGANVLLNYADGAPALAHGTPGLGNLLLCNFSVAEVASNLARQRVFPAWIQELVAQLSGERVHTPRHAPGDAMEADVWATDKADFIGPDGLPVPAAHLSQGERALVSIHAKDPGFYTLTNSRKQLAHLLAANIHPAETDLRPLDAELAGKLAQGDGPAGTQALAAGTDYGHLIRGQPVFHWFILAALGMLLVESLVQSMVRRKVT